jgi:hypothetical protein
MPADTLLPLPHAVLKIFRATVLRQVRLYGEMHRFIPTWIATVTAHGRIRAEPVGHRARIHGRSKYGVARTFKVLLALLPMYFFGRFRASPGHLFGRIGLVCGCAGGLRLGWLAGWLAGWAGANWPAAKPLPSGRC